MSGVFARLFVRGGARVAPEVIVHGGTQAAARGGTQLLVHGGTQAAARGGTELLVHGGTQAAAHGGTQAAAHTVPQVAARSGGGRLLRFLGIGGVGAGGVYYGNSVLEQRGQVPGVPGAPGAPGAPNGAAPGTGASGIDSLIGENGFFNSDSLIVGGIGALIGYFVGDSAMGALIGGGIGAVVGKPLVETVFGMINGRPLVAQSPQATVSPQQQPNMAVAQQPVTTVPLQSVNMSGVPVTGGVQTNTAPIQILPAGGTNTTPVR